MTVTGKYERQKLPTPKQKNTKSDRQKKKGKESESAKLHNFATSGSGS